MNDRQRHQRAKQEACEYVNELMIESVIKHKSLTSFLLVEAFTADDFDTLVRELVNFANMLPAEMSRSRTALKAALEGTKKTYLAFRKGQVDGKKFATLTTNLAGLVEAIGSALKEIGRLAPLKAAARKLGESVILEQKTVGDILDDTDKQILKVTVGSAFKSDSFLARLIPQLGEKKKWYGLTAEDLISDIESLTLAGLQKVMSSVPQELADELSDGPLDVDDVEALAQQIESGTPEGQGEEPTATTGSEETEPDQAPVIVKRSELGELLKSVKKTEGRKAQLDALANFFSARGITVESTQTAEEKLILERWRRMAGIPGVFEE